jgi:hypothetical protein
VPASSIASTSFGGVIFFLPLIRGLTLSSSLVERNTGPYAYWSSEARKPRACLLFQLVR